MFTGSSVVVRSPEPLTAPIDDELVMLSPQQGAYFGLNNPGARIWELLARPRSVDGICAALTAEYDVDDATCRAEVATFLAELHKSRLIELEA